MRFGKILAAMAVAAAFSAGAVQSASAGPACEPDKLAEKYPSLAGKTIKIGGDPQTPPFVMRDAADFNNIVGFDADFAKAVMDCHGIKYEWFLAGWSGILPRLAWERWKSLRSASRTKSARLKVSPALKF
jgi:polar amino acid transport system substrate-binding protein